MATDEQRTGQDAVLKFWQRIDAGEWQLVTSFTQAHDAEILSMEFLPGNDIMASVSSDGTFKLWCAVEKRSSKYASKAVEAVQMKWICQSAASYKTYAATDLSVSADGSVLAVAYGRVLTMWNSLTMELLSTRTFDDSLTSICFSAFGKATQYIMCATKSTAYLYNVHTKSLVWREAICIRYICAHEKHAQFVLVSSTNEIVVIDTLQAAAVQRKQFSSHLLGVGIMHDRKR